MRAAYKYARISFGMLAMVAGLSISGCAMRSTTGTEVQEVTVANHRDVPGIVEYVWEEPMVDVIDVPPGLDPEGHYYRPAHQETVEIRQGRWNYYKGK